MEDNNNGGANSTSSPIAINESVHKSSVNLIPLPHLHNRLIPAIQIKGAV